MQGISPGKRPPAPDSSSTGAEQWVVAEGSDRGEFFHHSVLQKHTEKEFIMN